MALRYSIFSLKLLHSLFIVHLFVVSDFLWDNFSYIFSLDSSDEVFLDGGLDSRVQLFRPYTLFDSRERKQIFKNLKCFNSTFKVQTKCAKPIKKIHYYFFHFHAIYCFSVFVLVLLLVLEILFPNRGSSED